MKFKMKPIKSKSFLLINYIDNNEEMFDDKSKNILSSSASEIQKDILKCYYNAEYFASLSEKKREEIYNELEDFYTRKSKD